MQARDRWREGGSRLCDAVELSRVLCHVIPVLVRVQLERKLPVMARHSRELKVVIFRSGVGPGLVKNACDGEGCNGRADSPEGDLDFII
jgi:hypothetical protein